MTATSTPIPDMVIPTAVPPTCTATPVPATLTSTPVPLTATPTLTPTPAIPTYSDVLSTYPSDAELSCTDALLSEVTSDGSWVFTGGIICPGRSRLTVAEGGTLTTDLDGPWGAFIGYGAKITVVQEVTIDGVTYAAGTLLTVDVNLEWIVVSSWD